MVIKRNVVFDRFEVDWKVMLKELYDQTTADGNKVYIPVLEEHGVCFYTISTLEFTSMSLDLKHVN